MKNKSESRRLYKLRHPDVVKRGRLNYLDRKFKKNPDWMNKLEGQIRNDFTRLTRLMYDDVLPKKCEYCGNTDDLQIHHKRYVYPIEKRDIIRLCKKCHVLEHQRLPIDVRESLVSYGKI